MNTSKSQIKSNEAPSDVNITVDGSTYPGWKMSRFEKQIKNFSVVKNAAGYYPGLVSPSATDGASLSYGLKSNSQSRMFIIQLNSFR